MYIHMVHANKSPLKIWENGERGRIQGLPNFLTMLRQCWWRSIVVKTAGSAGVLSLSYARLTAGRVTTLWVKRPLSVSQQGRLSLPSLRGR